MRRFFSILVFCAVALVATAQKIVSVSGEFTYYAPATMSLEAAKQEALLQTRLHVLAAKFGTVINSTTNIFIQNREGQDAHSETNVSTLATHEVRGEWIEDTRQPEQEIIYDKSLPNTTIIKTHVWGMAREITTAKAELDIHLLKDTTRGSDADVFYNEQPFYLSLQSPVAGYVAVYLLDHNAETAYCLLPSAADGRGAIPVESNRRYVFFSQDYVRLHYLSDKTMQMNESEKQLLGEEYMFTSDRSAVINQLIVVFSPNEFFKAKDNQQTSDNYTLPRETSIHLFNKWLAHCKTHDTQMQSTILTAKIIR